MAKRPLLLSLAPALLLLLQLACGRSEMYGGAIGGLAKSATGASVGSSGRSTGRTSAGTASGSSGRSPTSAGSLASTGTPASGSVGTGSTSAGQVAGGSTSDVGSVSGGSGSTGTPTASGTAGGSSGSVSGTGSGTGGSSSSGTSASGGSSTGSGCSFSIPVSEGQLCQVDSDCGCPTSCITDARGQVCEFACVQLSDCPNTSTICNGTNCVFNTCGPGTGNGSFNSTCDVVGINDGTCIPFPVDGGLSGQCVQGGSSSTCCNGNADRSDLAGTCEAGMVCSGGPQGECGQACDPFQPGECPGGQFCALTVDDSSAGTCFDPNGSICDAGM